MRIEFGASAKQRDARSGFDASKLVAGGKQIPRELLESLPDDGSDNLFGAIEVGRRHCQGSNGVDCNQNALLGR